MNAPRFERHAVARQLIADPLLWLTGLDVDHNHAVVQQSDNVCPTRIAMQDRVDKFLGMDYPKPCGGNEFLERHKVSAPFHALVGDGPSVAVEKFDEGMDVLPPVAPFLGIETFIN